MTGTIRISINSTLLHSIIMGLANSDDGLGGEVGALLDFRIQQMMYFSPTDVAHKIRA